MWMWNVNHQEEGNEVFEMGEERIRELCERVAVEIEKMNVRDLRVCEGVKLCDIKNKRELDLLIF